MLKELKFVHGAVASKDYVPALNHFRIADGRVEGFNGTLALSTPIDLAITAMPKATSFVKAIERLPEGAEVVMNLTKAGRISIKGGNFRAIIECWPEDEPCPQVVPEGEIYPMPGGILPVLKRVSPIMGIDASRPWACGILFKGQSAFVTNNIVVVEHWLPIVFPSPINLPATAVKEMLRIGIEPVAMQPERGAITFHYPNGAWLRTSLLSTEWPDLTRVLDKPSNARPVPEGFFEGVKRLDAFVAKDNRLYLRDGIISTSKDEEDGAQVELAPFGGKGCYHLSQMNAIAELATTIDLALYPDPAMFFGDMLRGAIVGMHV